MSRSAISAPCSIRASAIFTSWSIAPVCIFVDGSTMTATFKSHTHGDNYGSNNDAGSGNSDVGTTLRGGDMGGIVRVGTVGQRQPSFRNYRGTQGQRAQSAGQLCLRVGPARVHGAGHVGQLSAQDWR